MPMGENDEKTDPMLDLATFFQDYETDNVIDFEEHRKTITPYICQEGCKHYDPVQNPKKNELEEFCWAGNHSHFIKKGVICHKFESKYPVLPKGVLTF